MVRRLPRSTRTDTLCPYTTLFRSFFAVRVGRGRDTSLYFARDERCFRHGPIHQIDIGKPFGQLQRGLETVGKPGLYAVAADEAVHHHLDIVLQLLVERGSLVDLEELAVDADALEARLDRKSVV